MSARAGVSLAECLIALALGAVVCAAAASTLVSQGRVLRAMMAQQADGEAVRVATGVLRDELRWVDARADVRSIAGDSIAVRLFRGSAIVCAATTSELHVRYVGSRQPEPDKDSVLVVTPTGSRALLLQRAEPGGACDAPAPAATALPDGAAFRLAVSDAVDAVLVAVFESGVYYLSDAALRYRLGREGRQPLTDERFAPRGQPVALDAAEWTVAVPIAWPRSARRSPDTTRIMLVNRP